MNGKKFGIENIECENFVCRYENVKDFRTAFRKEFEYIIGFHATNLSEDEFKCIKTEGLKIASKELLEKKAKHRFIRKEFEELSNEIEKDITMWFSTDDLYENKFYTKNEINFGLIRDDLFEHYHYLLFGAESLLPVADYLTKRHHKQFRRILADSGLHYIIEAIIPVEKTNDIWIDCIYDFFKNESLDIPLVYNYDLLSENIVNIEEVDRPVDRQNLIFV